VLQKIWEKIESLGPPQILRHCHFSIIFMVPFRKSKDPEFPHSVESLGKRFEGEECEWVRALALSTSPVLFHKAEPTDACQGQLGDAWLIAAIAAVAEFPNYLKDKIFSTKQATADGKYELQLFDWKGSQSWKQIQAGPVVG
jgi:hypothetical protein